MSHFKVYIYSGANEDGELGKQIIPLFKVGDINKNANYGGIDAIRARRAGAFVSASTSVKVASPKTYTIAGTLGDNLGYKGAGVNASLIKADVLKQFGQLGWNVKTFDFDYYNDEKQYRFRMTTLVPASYNLEKVKLLATDAFLNFNGGWLGNYFTNVRLDASAQYVAPNPSGNSDSNPSGYVPSGSLFSLEKSLDDISKGLFGSMGTSTLLIAGVLAVIIIVKR